MAVIAKKSKHVAFDKEKLQELESHADVTNRSCASLIREAVEQYMKKVRRGLK